jgi:hypothetical protein
MAGIFHSSKLSLVLLKADFPAFITGVTQALVICCGATRARADQCVMRKKTGASTILKEIEEKRDFEFFSSSSHFSQSF